MVTKVGWTCGSWWKNWEGNCAKQQESSHQMTISEARKFECWNAEEKERSRHNPRREGCVMLRTTVDVLVVVVA